MKIAPGGNELRIPRNNTTAYVVYGTRDTLTAEQRANMMSQKAMMLTPGTDPADLYWPVGGCGVILLDYGPMSERTAQLLGLALKRDGGEGLIWANMVTGNTTHVTTS